jgi:hypothetical protein
MDSVLKGNLTNIVDALSDIFFKLNKSLRNNGILKTQLYNSAIEAAERVVAFQLKILDEQKKINQECGDQLRYVCLIPIAKIGRSACGYFFTEDYLTEKNVKSYVGGKLSHGNKWSEVEDEILDFCNVVTDRACHSFILFQACMGAAFYFNERNNSKLSNRRKMLNKRKKKKSEEIEEAEKRRKMEEKEETSQEESSIDKSDEARKQKRREAFISMGVKEEDIDKILENLIN